MPQILLVDDEELVRRSLSRMIRAENMGCGVIAAGSGKEALAVLSETPTDVILSDIRMPEMDGIELLTRLKADVRFQQIPVIVLTASDDSQTRNVALGLGAMDFVNKPADNDELIARIRNAIRLKINHDQLTQRTADLQRQIVRLQSVENIGVLSAGLAHDLNNALSVINGNAELSLLSENPATARSNIERIIEAGRHAAEMVRQLLDLGRARDDGGIPCDFQKVVRDGLSLLRPTTPKSVNLVLESDETPIGITANSTQVHQVLMNLLINAIHAVGEKGEIKVAVDIREIDAGEARNRDIEPGRYARFQVLDNGCGMDSETLERLFEPLFTTKEPGVGTGLGLSVSKAIVENTGGFITVDSSPNEGTVFKVYFPLQSTEVHAAYGPQPAR